MAMEKDKISRKAFANLDAATLSKLLSMDVVKVEPAPPRTRQTIHERETDVVLVIHTRDGYKFILHLEFQSSNDSTMVRRMAVYDHMLHKETGLDVLGIVIYIGGPALNMNNYIQFFDVCYSCPIIDIRTIDNQVFMNSSNPRQVIYALLAGPDDADKTSVIQKILSKLQVMLAGSPNEVTECVIEMEYLAQARSKHIQELIKKEADKMAITLPKENSLFYQEAFKLGETEGELRGEQKARRTDAINLMKAGVALDIISSCIGINRQELIELKKQIDQASGKS